MKIFKVSTLIFAMLAAGDSGAQESKKSPDLFSRLKNILSEHAGDIREDSTTIYSNGVKYGTALITPNRSERQTRDGMRSGMKAVGAAAHMAGAIGGTAGGAFATGMAVPVADGIEVMPEWALSDNVMARNAELAVRGDTATLQREETERIRNRQEIAERFKSSPTQFIANPTEYKPQSMIEKLDSFQKDTLPKAQQQLAREMQNSVPQQIPQTVQPTPLPNLSSIEELPSTENLAELCGMQCTSEDSAENPPEPEIEEPQPLHWKTLSGRMQNGDGSIQQAAQDMIGKCEPVGAANAIEYIARMRAEANVSQNGESCTAAQFFDDTTDRLTFAKECDVPNWGRTTVLQNYRVRDDRTVDGFIKYKTSTGTMQMDFVNGYCG